MNLVGKKFIYNNMEVTVCNQEKRGDSTQISIKVAGQEKKLNYELALSKGIIIPINSYIFMDRNFKFKYSQTSAADIYRELVEDFGFDENLESEFQSFSRLCASKASPENYGVWFIAYSNLSSVQPGKKWSNIVKGKMIYEEWEHGLNMRMLGNIDEKRIVFVKVKSQSYSQLNDIYKFYGVYQCIGIDEKSRIKTYEMVSNVYPF